MGCREMSGFTACSFWLVEALARSQQADKALGGALMVPSCCIVQMVSNPIAYRFDFICHINSSFPAIKPWVLKLGVLPCDLL